MEQTSSRWSIETCRGGISTTFYRGEKYDNVARSLDYIRAHKVQVRGDGNISHAEQDDLRVEVLDAPLSSDGETVDMILKVVARSESSGLSL